MHDRDVDRNGVALEMMPLNDNGDNFVTRGLKSWQSVNRASRVDCSFLNPRAMRDHDFICDGILVKRGQTMNLTHSR